MNIARSLIVLFWLLMTGWLIRYEAFPRWFTASVPGYRSLFKNGPLILDTWMQIEFRNTPVGYSHTWVDSDVASPNATYTLHNQTALNIKLMGQIQGVNVIAGATLDAGYALQKFYTVVSSSVYTTRIDGRKTGDHTFTVRIRTDSGEQTVTLTVPDDVILYSPVTEMALAGLKPGESLSLRVLDPITLSISDVRVEALRREKLKSAGREQETTVLKLVYQGLETLSWMDSEGRILRQETPFGWNMTLCSAKDVLAFKQDAARADDLLMAMAVPCRGQVQNPRACQMLKIQINGASISPQDFASPRQIIADQEDRRVCLTVRAQAGPSQPAVRGSVPEALRPLLASSPALQADHPAMLRQARAIIGDETNSWVVAQAIGDWVFRVIEKKTTVSLPSALDVLARREGDCNEHTYLFVALARAAGLPARIHVGLVYSEMDGAPGAFYYHAWPSVYVGEWVELDPTLGQKTVDATHISVAQGEIADQLKLLGLMGQVSVEIVEER
ncbi:MAG: transglutaminase family protein [Kiritimatiellae bacterium]|nr:transglutaminase family protein [Verrucomicrobiota bacterium]MBU4285320.1 transglutaminase family protein [Verrucomicrobiota bacterium]MBU4366588.1 transglutaminase family protein [Verrucomicrobiota bacterium]MCG2661243.1 transglutaminase family protein [Kiritimatiellia bacterium]